MIHLVTFATADMSESKELCVASALRHGVNDYDVLNYSTLQHQDFYKENEGLLSQSRGAGYWAWKPYLIQQAVDYGTTGSYVIYADAGIEFVGDVKHIIDRMDQDIFLFGNNWEHAHWCKADIVKEVWPEWWMDNGDPQDFESLMKQYLVWAPFGKQCQASVIFFRVSDYSRKFVKEWLDWCLFEGGRLIDDSPSRTPNHPEFQENRHDQAILTTLAYREGIKLHWWPAIYNDGQFTYEKLPVYAGDDYPPIFHHHRRRNHEWSSAA